MQIELKEGGLTKDLENSPTSSQKPPIGIIPKYLYDEQVRNNRFNELKETIKRYCDAGLPLNPEWVTEYDELVKSKNVFPNEKPKTSLERFKELFDSVGIRYKEVNDPVRNFIYIYFQDGRGNETLLTFFKDGRM